MTHSYLIKGMTCTSCVAKVKSEFLKLGNVLSADIQLAFPQATITMDKHITTQDLQVAIKKAGNYSIEENAHESNHMSGKAGAISSDSANLYFPIFLIFGYITGTTLLIQTAGGSFNSMQWMHHFMGAFFLVFSFFKLMNLRGFAEGYSTYDVVAKQFAGWGYIYPFIELALGLSFMMNLYPLATNILAFIVMAVSSIGVIQSLLNKTPFQCACLGTVFKLPLSKVTLFEDLLMVVMSLISIIEII